MFDNNARPLLFALIGICFKTVSVLAFSTFTQKILDTVSGTETHTISDLVLYALSCVVCLLIAAVLEYEDALTLDVLPPPVRGPVGAFGLEFPLPLRG